MARRVLVVGMLLALTACGCWPKRIIWSPDGQRAVLIGSEQLYLCDREGRLSEATACQAGAVCWFADSQRLLVQTHEEITGWDELAPLLSDEQRGDAVALAKKLRQEVLAAEGPWDDFKPRTLEDVSATLSAAVLLCMRDRFGEGLAEKIGEKWQELEEFTTTVWIIRHARVQNGRLVLGPVLVRSLESILEVRISPSQAAVAFTAERLEGTAALFVVGIDPPAPRREVADAVAGAFDWTPDGQALVFAAAPLEEVEKDLICVGELRKRTVCNEAGYLLGTFSGTTELARLAYHPLLFKVRCLSDGRILFATQALELPYAGEIPRRVGLFAIDPARQPTVLAVLPADDKLPELVYCFQVSPDEKRLAIPGEKGRVAVVELATGQVRMVQTKECSRLWTVPTWRSADELCFAVPPGSRYGSEDRKEVVLWSSEGRLRRLSETWDDALVKDILRE